MKRINAVLAALTAATMTAPLILTAFAETVSSEDPYVWVTVANAGELEVTLEKVPLTDADGNGSLTVNDAIITTHDMFYDGGAAAGYKTKVTDWGDSIVRLWGVENGGSYGYTVNDQFAYGLSDPVQDGDSVYFYVYKDAATYTDTYSYFEDWQLMEQPELVGDYAYLSLQTITYDENWMPQVKPLAGAVITANGERTDYVTNENGYVWVRIDEVGSIVYSAECDDKIIVPPVARFQVEDPAFTTTDEFAYEQTSTAVDGGPFHIVADSYNDILVPGSCAWYYTYAYQEAEFSIEDESIARLTDAHGSYTGMACVEGVAPGETTLTAVTPGGEVATYTIVVVDPATTTTVTTLTTQTTLPDPDETTESTTSTDPIIITESETTESTTSTDLIITTESETTEMTTVTEATVTTAPVGDLPQTGNNDMTGMLVLLGTFALTGTGFTVLKRSGVLDSEE